MISKKKLEKMKEKKIQKCNQRKVNKNIKEIKTKILMVEIVDMKKKRMMRKKMKNNINS